MTQTTTIDGVSRTSVIKRSGCEWVEHAYLGEVGTGTIEIHDDSSAITVVGHKTIVTEQSASTPPRIFTGFVGRKGYDREGTDVMYTGSLGVVIKAGTKDGNDLLNRYIITGTDGKRSAETVSARITWLLASDYLSGLVVDDGAVTYPTDISLDATDYRGQRPGDVLAACAKKANFNYYVRWNVAGAEWELVFRDDNASTDDTCTVSIANDGTANGTSIFAPFQDSTLDEDPEDVYSDVYATYAKGSVTDTRAATASTFVTRWGATDDSGIKTSAQASDQAEDFLWQSHTEEHSLTLTIRMRAAYVGLVQAGQRISVTLTHLAALGYDSATYFRILRKRVRQPLDTDNDYDVTLDLSPQEDGPPAAAIVQSAFGHTADGGGSLSFANPVTIGNLLVFCVSASHDSDPDQPNTTTAQPNWGTATWTKLPNSTITNAYGTGHPYGIAIWYKTADSANQTGWIGSTAAAVGIYEITGADIASASSVSQTLQTAANPMTIGSLGSPVAGSVSIMLGNWADASAAPDFADPTYTATANGWTTDLLYWVPAVYPRWNPPITYICHALGDGSALSASGTRSDLGWLPGQWCGAAISIPPV